MNAIVLTREDAGHVLHALHNEIGHEFTARLTNGSNGATWIDAVPDEDLKAIVRCGDHKAWANVEKAVMKEIKRREAI